MNSQNIKKNIKKKNSTSYVLKLIRKQEIIFFFLCCATKAEKIEHTKTSYLLTLEDKAKPNTNTEK